MILHADTIFTGEKFVHDHHLVISNDKIIALHPNIEWDKQDKNLKNLPVIDFKKSTLIPGLIDIHINGGGGVLFNNHQDVKGLQKIISAHALGGTTAIMPTLITDTLEATQKALTQTAKVIQSQEVPSVLGIHLEGPFINPHQGGTHNPKLMLKPNNTNLKKVINAAQYFPGKKIITLAPELFTLPQLKAIKKAGFIIMAGHTDADINTLMARAEYLDGFTHFYNGMGKISARLPQSVGYVLSAKKKFWLSMIIDNIHIHPAMLNILFSLHPSNRVILITDAMPTLGGDKHFYFQGKKISLKNNLLVDQLGVISGSHLSMIQAIENINHVKGNFFSIAEILRMGSLYPAQFLGLNTPKTRYGKLKSGYQANITVINKDLSKNTVFKKKPSFKVKATMIDGKWVHQ